MGQADGGDQGQRTQQDADLGRQDKQGHQALLLGDIAAGGACENVQGAGGGYQEEPRDGKGQQACVLRGKIPGEDRAVLGLRRQTQGKKDQNSSQDCQQYRQGNSGARRREAGIRLIAGFKLQQPQGQGSGAARQGGQGDQSVFHGISESFRIKIRGFSRRGTPPFC